MGDWLAEETYQSPRRTRSSVPPANGASVFELTVIEGPDRGRIHVIDASSGRAVMFGTSAVCTVRLGDSNVSARQCSFELEGDRLRVMDISPEKSTRVNGVITHEGYLIGGEIVRIGATVIGVKRTDRQAANEVSHSAFGRIYGEHPEMTVLYPAFAQLAYETAPLFILGERGTGKRLLAEELHNHGPRHEGPFVVIARGEPDSLTPAAIDEASGGTLYLEEGADFERVVLEHVLALSDIRVIVGTRGDRPLPVSAGRRVSLPPLRARASDVAVLARKLWAELGGEDSIPDDFVARFEDHTWPGNVRELRIAVQDRILHGQDTTVSGIVECVPSRASTMPPPPSDAMKEICENTLPFAEARSEVLAEFEKRYVDRALEKAGHNVARAAANSGIAHRYFQVLKSRRKSA